MKVNNSQGFGVRYVFKRKALSSIQVESFSDEYDYEFFQHLFLEGVGRGKNMEVIR